LKQRAKEQRAARDSDERSAAAAEGKRDMFAKKSEQLRTVILDDLSAGAYTRPFLSST
jgi:hypothetical protein